MTSVSVVLLASGGVALLWAAVRSRRYWTEPGGQQFTALVGTFAAAALSLAAAPLDPLLELVGTALLFAVTPVLWATFAFEYTGRFDVGTRRRRLLFLPSVFLAVSHVAFRLAASRVTGIPLADVAIGTTYAVVEAASGLLRTVVEVVFLLQYGGTFYLMGLMVAATVVVLAQFASYDHLDLRVGLLLVAAGTGPWFVKMTGDAIVNMAQLDAAVTRLPVAASFALAGCLVLSSLLRYDPFEATPAAGTVGPELVLEDLSEPVVVVDADGEVIRLNPAARRSFDADAGDVGAPIDALLGCGVEHLRDASTVELDGVEGRRHYEPTVSPLTSSHGRVVGHAVVLRDVTDREMRQQRLQVLNRVLRHNLRNEMTTVRGRAEMLTADHGDLEEIERAITDTADGLVELGERAREIERMLSAPEDPDARCTVRSVVDEVRRTVREDLEADADVTVDVPDDLEAAVDEQLLAPVLRNLLDNAVRHSDRPAVEVVAGRARDAESLPVVLRVIDDGPGLPDNERRAIERGQEDALEHGSGLGLWAVRWGVTRMGGAFSISDRDSRGTVVEVRLPVPDGDGDGDPSVDGGDDSGEGDEREDDPRSLPREG